MMLVDDAAMRLIEPLAQMDLPKLYDTQLMLGGGHISGFAVEGEPAARTAELIAQMQRESGGFFLAVGDGNHSLATAKACWEQIKPTLSEAERENHPRAGLRSANWSTCTARRWSSDRFTAWFSARISTRCKAALNCICAPTA